MTIQPLSLTERPEYYIGWDDFAALSASLAKVFAGYPGTHRTRLMQKQAFLNMLKVL